MLKFAVFGSPISHSLSPQIHSSFAKQFGITLNYERIQTEPGHLKASLIDFHKQQGIGANITVPLKQEAYGLCQRLSKSAELAQAVNTIGWNDNEEIWGDNTDGQGLIRDLTLNHQVTLTGKRILLLGAGGAARGILAPLLAFEPTLMIANRDLEKALLMISHYPQVAAVTYDGLLAHTQDPFDLIINATSASLDNHIPSLAPHVVNNACCVDLAYRFKEPTPFLQWAEKHHARKTLDGLGMLVEQAALGFALWHGQTPDTKAVIASLR